MLSVIPYICEGIFQAAFRVIRIGCRLYCGNLYAYGRLLRDFRNIRDRVAEASACKAGI